VRIRRISGGRATAVLVGLCLTTLAACGTGNTGSAGAGDGDGHDNGMTGATLQRASVPVAKPDAAVSTEALANGMTRLGYRMATALAQQSSEGNLVYSPASLAIAFAMVREGATGASAKQIDRVLGLPHNRQQAFNALISALRDPGAGNTLDVGNAIFTANGYPIRAQFLDTLQRWYGAGVYQTTFPEPAKDAVNAYVAKQTHDLIPELITDQFDTSTVMSLINTLYLNGRWAYPFDPDLTAVGSFTTKAGDSVETKMMSVDSHGIGYTEGAGWQAVRLPYSGDDLAMVVLVPSVQGEPPSRQSASHDLPSPESLLSPSVLDQAIAGFAPAHVSLEMPRWSFGTTSDLADLFASLGMKAPFEPGGFPGITSDPRLKLDSVVQQARIDVAEKGTVAAAVTQVEMQASSLSADLRMVTADHPFAYAIVSTSTGVPVFEGTVGDPTAS